MDRAICAFAFFLWVAAQFVAQVRERKCFLNFDASLRKRILAIPFGDIGLRTIQLSLYRLPNRSAQGDTGHGLRRARRRTDGDAGRSLHHARRSRSDIERATLRFAPSAIS